MAKPILYLFNGKVGRFGNAVFGDIPKVYTVTLDTVTHGYITASPNSGVAGTTITLSSTIDTGYELEYYTVNGVPIVGNTFTMPAANVTVGASIQKEVDPLNPLDLPSHTIRARFTSGYTPSVGDTQTLVDSTTNIWDIYKESNNWGALFATVGNKLLEVLGANTTGVTAMNDLFYNCTSLTTVPLFDTSSSTSFTEMFSSCTGLLSVPKFNTSSAESVSRMFTWCTHLTTIPDLDLSRVRSADGYVKSCTALTTVPTLRFGNSLYYANELFAYCSSLTSVPPFNISQIDVQLGSAFRDCTALTAVPAFSSVGRSSRLDYMFYGCTNVESGALAFYQVASAGSPRQYYNCFYNCGSNTTTGAAELAQIPSSWGGTGA